MSSGTLDKQSPMEKAVKEGNVEEVKKLLRSVNPNEPYGFEKVKKMVPCFGDSLCMLE